MLNEIMRRKSAEEPEDVGNYKYKDLVWARTLLEKLVQEGIDQKSRSDILLGEEEAVLNLSGHIRGTRNLPAKMSAIKAVLLEEKLTEDNLYFFTLQEDESGYMIVVSSIRTPIYRDKKKEKKKDKKQKKK